MNRRAIVLLGAGLVFQHTNAHAQSAGCGAAPYECAVAQIQHQDFADAIRTLEPLIRQAPRDLKTLNLLGLALTGAGRVEEAHGRFLEALAIDEGFYPARKNLAINEFNGGRFAEAEKHFQQVLERVPADPIVHVHLAEIHVQRKDWRGALPHYEKGASRLSQNPIWLLHYASCLLESGEPDKAVATFDAVPAGDGASLFEAGVALGRAGAHAQAARFFDRARASYKDPYAAGYNRTLMLVEAGDHAGAIRSAEAMFAEGSRTAELYNLVSRAYVKAERIKEAYDALREATRLEPTAEEHYTDLAMICLDHENYDLGLEIVDVGLQYLPTSGTLHIERGVLLIMKGSFALAEEAFAAAQKGSPHSAIPSIALAMAWMQTGENPKAVDLLRRRTALNASDPIVFHTLGLALLRSGADPTDASGEEALRSFTTAIRLDPDFGSARAELGKLLLKRGDVAGAVEQLEKAVALDPDRTSPAYALAQAYRRLGETARAQTLLARVSKLNAKERGDDPDHELKRNVMRIVRANDLASPKSDPPTSNVRRPK